MRVLFIGNSHTYYNDMPALFSSLAKERGIPCEVTMIAHGGWFLSQHVQEPDVKFNILYGHYDYVVLQEHAHPFGPVEQMTEAMQTLCGWIGKAGSRPVAYMTWEQQDKGQDQPVMTAAYEKAARQYNMILAPVGKLWWEKLQKDPSLPLFGPDGQHASPEGSAFAAQVLLDAIVQDTP